MPSFKDRWKDQKTMTKTNLQNHWKELANGVKSYHNLPYIIQKNQQIPLPQVYKTPTNNLRIFQTSHPISFPRAETKIASSPSGRSPCEWLSAGFGAQPDLPDAGGSLRIEADRAKPQINTSNIPKWVNINIEHPRRNVYIFLKEKMTSRNWVGMKMHRKHHLPAPKKITKHSLHFMKVIQCPSDSPIQPCSSSRTWLLGSCRPSSYSGSPLVSFVDALWIHKNLFGALAP